MQPEREVFHAATSARTILDMPLSVDEAREKQRKVYLFLCILGVVAFFGLMAWKTLTAPRFGEPCEDRCFTGECLRETRLVGNIPWAGDAYCTRTCKGPDDCPAGYVCGDVVEVERPRSMPIEWADTKDAARVHACVKRR